MNWISDGASMFSIDGKELIGLYLLLKSEENHLDKMMSRLLNRIEDDLFERLSIDEFENLEKLYDQGFDAFHSQE